MSSRLARLCGGTIAGGRAAGTWKQMQDRLREMVRVKQGRKPTPSADIIESQSVKASQKGALLHLLGKAKPVWPAHGVVRGQSPLDHRIASSAASGEESAPRLAPVNELSTTPDHTNGEKRFTITHPFHRLCGQTFPMLSQRFAWGEERVFFPDPQTHEVRSLPMAWTSLVLPDPFLVVAYGKAVLRFVDLQHLVQLLKDRQISGQQDH